MPYVNNATRDRMLVTLESHPTTAGELNYIFTMIALDYLGTNEESYQTYNDIIGALEGCKLELYRRMVAPYETKKRIENGDVYPK